MSMIRIVAHRGEEITLGFGFAKQFAGRPDARITRVESIRVERRVGQDYEDATAELFDTVDGVPDQRITEDGRTVLVRKKRVKPESTEQPPGVYLCHVRVRTSEQEEPVTLDADGRVPVLLITDGR